MGQKFMKPLDQQENQENGGHTIIVDALGFGTGFIDWHSMDLHPY